MVHEGEARLRRVIDHMWDGYIEADVDGAILEAGPSCAGLLGAPRERLLGAVHIASPPGVGTTVTLLFPRAHPH